METQLLMEPPATVKGSFGCELDTQLDSLTKGLKFESEMQGITTETTPDHLTIEDGNISLYAQVFVAPIREEMTNAIYNKRARCFTEYEIESGRKFLFSELARLVRAGKITIPHYHDVDGDYMRSNPDITNANNLRKLFKN